MWFIVIIIIIIIIDYNPNAYWYTTTNIFCDC